MHNIVDTAPRHINRRALVNPDIVCGQLIPDT